MNAMGEYEDGRILTHRTNVNFMGASTLGSMEQFASSNDFGGICSIRIFSRCVEGVDKWVDPDTKQVYMVGDYVSGKTPYGVKVYSPTGKYLGYCPNLLEQKRLSDEYLINVRPSIHYQPIESEKE